MISSTRFCNPEFKMGVGVCLCVCVCVDGVYRREYTGSPKEFLIRVPICLFFFPPSLHLCSPSLLSLSLFLSHHLPLEQCREKLSFRGPAGRDQGWACLSTERETEHTEPGRCSQLIVWIQNNERILVSCWDNYGTVYSASVDAVLSIIMQIII